MAYISTISPLYLPYISPISPIYLEPGEHGGDQLAHDPRARQGPLRGGRRVARLTGRGKARAEPEQVTTPEACPSLADAEASM